MKDKTKIILASLFTIMFCVIYFFVVNSISFYAYEKYIDERLVHFGYVHPDFVTEYTEKEHIERITDITKKRKNKLIESGEIVNIYVDILYAFFDEDPEYFLVEIEYLNEKSYVFDNITYYSKFEHAIGYISNDKYYLGMPYYNYDDCFGKSPYTEFGYKDFKKYYGHYTCAVNIDGQMTVLYDKVCLAGNDYEGNNHDTVVRPSYHLFEKCSHCQIGTVLSKETQFLYMQKNYKSHIHKYD